MVTDGTGLLAADHVASLTAPIIDRLRLAIHHATQGCAAGMARERGLDRPMGMVIGNLRNVPPGQSITRSAVLSVFAYQAPSIVNSGIDGLVRAGLLDDLDGDLVQVTAEGLEITAAIHARGDEVAGELWSGHDDRVARLADLAARALRAAAADAGEAFTVMAPLAEPAGATEAALLGERLTGLRFHRFDAHVAAWRSAGLTVEQVKDLPPGAERDGIESDTNRRAASAYEVFDPAERLEFLAGLAALPG